MLGKSDHLFFLIGMDAFKYIAKWYEAEALLKECDFIVAARPGYSLADVASSLPPSLRPSPAVTKLFRKQAIEGPLVLREQPFTCFRKLMRMFQRRKFGPPSAVAAH